MRQMQEKDLAKKKELWMAFVDLEKDERKGKTSEDIARKDKTSEDRARKS